MGTRSSVKCCNTRRTLRVITIIFVLFQYPSVYAGIWDCKVNLDVHPGRYLPLVTSKTDILLPTGNKYIGIRENESVQVTCPGKRNSFVGQRDAIVNATCKVFGHLVFSNSNSFQMKCTNPVKENLKETNINCGSNHNSKKIYIGWTMPNGDFFRQIEICFNYDSLTTEYTRHIIFGYSMPEGHRDGDGQKHAVYKNDKFFSMLPHSIASSYTKEKQKETMTQLLGRKKAKDYIGGWGPNSYLVKGQLTPDADFALPSWQQATYHYINVVPVWQDFINGKWKILEENIRTLVHPSSLLHPPRNLTVYTGTYGVLDLKPTSGFEVPIYLSQIHNRVPVPKYIWKIVSDPIRNESVAFVLHNHPATTRPYNWLSDLDVCHDACLWIHWITWKTRDDAHKGTLFCCRVDDLKKKFKNIPDEVPHKGLLQR